MMNMLKDDGLFCYLNLEHVVPQGIAVLLNENGVRDHLPNGATSLFGLELPWP